VQGRHKEGLPESLLLATIERESPAQAAGLEYLRRRNIF